MFNGVLKTSAILATLAGLTVGGGVMHLAWQHNPQREFHGPEGVNWFDRLLIGFSWFGVSTCVLFIVLAAILLMVRVIRP